MVSLFYVLTNPQVSDSGDSGRFVEAEQCGEITVYTDMKTGGQYAVTDNGICPILKTDGSLWEAGGYGGDER